MSNIFSGSNIAKVIQFASLDNWEFSKSLGFWFVMGMIGMFGVSTLIIRKGVPNYCIMDKLDKLTAPTKA